jgi:hypothetical protein
MLRVTRVSSTRLPRSTEGISTVSLVESLDGQFKVLQILQILFSPESGAVKLVITHQ